MRFLKRALKAGLACCVVVGVLAYLYIKGIPKNSLAFALIGKPVEISLVGTGSMYPTLYWDKNQGGPEEYDKAIAQNKTRVLPQLYLAVRLNFKNFSYENPRIGFGDIVSFTKNKENYIKRVIGIPGDALELRDGYVIRNGNKLKEPYTLKDRSTFGNESFQECVVLKIPDNNYFVMGDNRKSSLDSRADLGLIEKNEIGFILPFSKQLSLQSKYRFAGIESDKYLKPTLNAEEFVTKVNELRAREKVGPLKLNIKLNNSSEARGKYILTNNYFSSRDEKGNKLFLQEMERFGYSNIIAAEDVIHGYFDSDELIGLRHEFKELNELLLNKQHQDIGVATVNQDLNGCPTQLIILHFGGYVPPSYDSAILERWQKAYKLNVDSSRDWKSLRGNNLYNQIDLEIILKLYEEVIQISQEIKTKIERLEWFNNDDQFKVSRYEILINQINKQAEKINSEAKNKSARLRQKNYEICTANWKLYVKKESDCEKFLN